MFWVVSGKDSCRLCVQRSLVLLCADPARLCAGAVFWVVIGFLDTNECGIYLKYIYDIWTDRVHF